MKIQSQIETKITQQLQPEYLQISNESHLHNVPAGSEYHFNLTIVSSQFNGKPLIARHRMVNTLLAEELQNDIHALTMLTLTPEEWQQRGGSQDSPPCRGGFGQ